MKRIFLTIAYDGTAYCGFQKQPELPTIEGTVQSALFQLTKEETELIGASRTDSGVHAYGNVAVFDTESTIPPGRFYKALNPLLPPDIRITDSFEVPADFHPRRQNCIKTYEYRVSFGETEDPQKRLYAMHYRFSADPERMRRAAAFLVGEHDFTSFTNPSSQVLQNGGSPVRTIYSVEIEELCSAASGVGTVSGIGAVSGSGTASGNGTASGCGSVSGEGGRQSGGLVIRIRGNGFLYNMVRIIAGTLLEIGRGRFEPSAIKEMLAARDRAAAGPTADARGLCLMSIEYAHDGGRTDTARTQCRDSADTAQRQCGHSADNTVRTTPLHNN